MAKFGGMGGFSGLLDFHENYSVDEFACALRDVLGEQMKADDEVCAAVWCALVNVEWEHKEDNHTAGYSFRAAGDLIAAIVGRGDYLDWYCCDDMIDSAPGMVAPFIADKLLLKGWTVIQDE